MASATGAAREFKQPDRGYDKEIYAGNNSLDNKFTCQHCQLMLRDPVQSTCGHRFCNVCFVHLCGDSKEPNTVECPACRMEESFDAESSYMNKEEMFPDMAMRRELSKLQCKCVNQGCNWSGVFKNYKAHEVNCEFRGVTCPACHKNIPEPRLEEHLKKECPQRLVKCEHCHLEFKHSDLKQHDKNCPKVSITCDACHKRITREQHTKHMEEECVKRIVACPAGCSDMLRYDQLQTHIQKNNASIGSHLKYVLEATSQINKKIEERTNALTAPNVVESLEQSLNQLTSRIEALETAENTSAIGASGGVAPEDDIGLASRIASTEVRLNAFEPILGILHKEIEKCITTIEGLERKRTEDTRTLRKKVEDCEQLVKNMEKLIMSKDILLNQYELRFESLEFSRQDGVLTWKITNFKQKRLDALAGKTTSLYSPTFYTKPVGYRMCARLYPNGDGMGKNSHLSLFFVMMRGHFDSLLPWPFKEKVTLMLVDQNMKEHIVDTFKPDVTSSSFKRPESEMNIASGCPLFLPLCRLDDPNYGFVKDDVMFVRIIVDQVTTSGKYEINPLKGNMNYVTPQAK